MSWSDEFGKLPITFKGAVATIATIMPFWFISIYLFHKPLFNSNNYYLLISLCFCFSITWYSITVVVAAMGVHYLNDTDNTLDETGILIIGSIVSIVYLSAAIIVAYYYTWTFHKFLLVAYS